jgi:ADP-ribosyl-[dinitrogen reductase] hydrolase
MRSAIIGAYFANEAEKRRAFVSASTRLTHTDPKAETAALAVAEAAARAVSQNESAEEWLAHLASFGCDEEWQAICKKLADALASQLSVEGFADALGLQNGVTGYAYHSVPVAIYASLRHGGDFRQALEAALNCGGDTDTVGAIVGGIVGAGLGRKCIPGDLVSGVCEWPRSISLLDSVANRLAEPNHNNRPIGSIGYFWPGLILRNILFVVVVLVHGSRRLAPPY